MIRVPFQFVFRKSQQVDFEVIGKDVKLVFDDNHVQWVSFNEGSEEVSESAVVNGQYSLFKGTVGIVNSTQLVFIGDRINLPYEDQTEQVCLVAIS